MNFADNVGSSAYNSGMEIFLAPELEAKLNQVAAQTGRNANQVVQDLLASYLDHDRWFRQEVEKGIAALDRDEVVSHDDIRSQMERILGS